MSSKKFLFRSFIISVIFSYALLAQQELGDGWKLNGELQLRPELDGRDFSNQTHPLTFASLRTRLGVDKTFFDKLQLYIQFQDSRVLGGGIASGNSNNGVMLHQGFLKLINLFDWDWSIQAGRFEVSYGTERFFGSSNWSYLGRAFDGVRFNILPGNWDLDLFALTIIESNEYIFFPTPLRYPYPDEPTPAYSVYGAYKKFVFDTANELDLLGYYEANRFRTAGGAKISDMVTFAGTHFGKYGNFKTTAELAYQFGQFIEARDINAYLISLSFLYNFGITDFGAGADILSGLAPGETEKKTNFEPNFGTNHKFYGYMDYFPPNAFGLGLNNFYAKAIIKPQDTEFSFAVDLHHFMSNKSSANDESTFGQEIDLTIKYDFIKGTALFWGGSLFFPGDIMRRLYSPGEDVAFWTYLMISASL